MSNGKTLVVYFSRADENYSVGTVEVGNTELLAKEIIAKTGAMNLRLSQKTNIRPFTKKRLNAQLKNARRTLVQNILTT